MSLTLLLDTPLLSIPEYARRSGTTVKSVSTQCDKGHLPFIQQESCFLRRSIIEKISITDIVEYPHAGDQKLWNLLARKTPLYIVNTYLGGSRMHSNRVSANPQYWEEFQTIMAKKTVGSRIKAMFQYIATHFFPEKLKRMLAKNLLEYKNGRWSQEN